MSDVTITVSQAGAALVTIQPLQMFVANDGGAGGAVPRFASPPPEFAIAGVGPYTLPYPPAFGLMQVIADGAVLRSTDYSISGTALTLSAGAAAAYTRLIVWMTY